MALAFGALVSFTVHVHAQQGQTPSNAALRSSIHDQYMQSGNSSITGTITFRAPPSDGGGLSRCGRADDIFLFPDTPFFQDAIERGLTNAPEPAWSDEDHRLMRMLVRVEHCDDTSQFKFEGLPPLPYIVYTEFTASLLNLHLLLRHVAPAAGQTINASLNETNVARPGRVRVGAPPPPAPPPSPLSLVEKSYAELHDRSANEILASTAQRALNAIRDRDFAEAAKQTKDYVALCALVRQCSEELTRIMHQGWRACGQTADLM